MTTLTALYLEYLGASQSFSSYLLWPACGLHAVVALLLARPAYEAVWRRSPGVAASSHSLPSTR